MSETQQIMVTLDELRALPAETEWLEFKEAPQSIDIDDLGALCLGVVQ